MIIAGPGIGKIYTLINRALNLIVNKNVDPSKILFATFTEKAAHKLILDYLMNWIIKGLTLILMKCILEHFAQFV